MEQLLKNAWTCKCSDRYIAGPGENLGALIWWHQMYFHAGARTKGRFRTFRVIRPQEGAMDDGITSRI